MYNNYEILHGKFAGVHTICHNIIKDWFVCAIAKAVIIFRHEIFNIYLDTNISIFRHELLIFN